MKLDFEQIKSITQGTMRITQEEGGYRFHRFSEEEQSVYAYDRGFTEKTYCTAGVQMVFKTDAAALCFTVNEQPLPTSRKFFAFDFFVNDKKIGCIKNFEGDVIDLEDTSAVYTYGIFSKKFELGDGEKTVRIIFPWMSLPTLQELELIDASYFEPIKRPKKMVMYGDSITHGYDSSYPSNSYAVKLAHSLDAELFNKGICADTFSPALADVKNDINPDYVTVAYGTNDWTNKKREDFERDCKQFYENVSKNYPDSTIFAISPIWRKDLNDKSECGEFLTVTDYIKSVTDKLDNVHFIRGFDFVPHDENMYCDLRLHPNDKGFDHYFNNLKKEIDNILKKLNV